MDWKFSYPNAWHATYNQWKFEIHQKEESSFFAKAYFSDEAEGNDGYTEIYLTLDEAKANFVYDLKVHLANLIGTLPYE